MILTKLIKKINIKSLYKKLIYKNLIEKKDKFAL